MRCREGCTQHCRQACRQAPAGRSAAATCGDLAHTHTAAPATCTCRKIAFSTAAHAARPKGVQAVAERLAAGLGDLRYGCEVQRISWAGPGVTLACAGGETLHADAAIVTVSLGVLKAAHGALFDPPLPAAKAAAIDRLQVGVVDKVMLDFAPEGRGSGSGSSSDGRAASPNAAAPADSPPVSFALLGGGPWGGFGSQGAPALTSGEEELPAWARDIFSIRFGGPELKRPGEQREPASQPAAAPQADDGVAEEEEEEEFSPCAEAAQPTCHQAVAWLTGAAAAAMESASEAEVLAALRTLCTRVFPRVQLPPGASWDAVRLHR